MKLLDILDREGVVPALAGSDKRAVLGELANHVAARSGGKVAAADLLRRFEDRERDRSTGIGEGVAVPHARAAGVDRLIVVFGRSPAGVDFAAMDHQPVTLFFALVSPDDQPAVHLTALARICKLLKSPAFRAKLLEAKDREGVFRTLQDEDARV